MSAAYLCLNGLSNGAMEFARDSKEREELISRGGAYRISPIFPVCAHAVIPSSLDCRILFLTVERPFATLGSLLNHLPDLKASCWFSLGLASIVLINVDQSVSSEVMTFLSTDLRAWEEWHVQNGQIIEAPFYRCEPATFDRTQYAIATSLPDLNYDSQMLLDDIRLSIETFVALSAQYSPSYLSLASDLVGQVNSLSKDLSSQFTTMNIVARETVDSSSVDFNQERIHRITDQLVQLNSVLSYAISQSFAGATPIFQNASIIHNHSLLGIAVAVNALRSLLYSAEDAFQKIPVASYVKYEYARARGFDVFRKETDLDFDKWVEVSDFVDEILDVPPKAEISYRARPHVLFFSGRLGFQEAPNSISAAVQSIRSCASVRWSILTLTHEIMHAHVRDLLGAIFFPGIHQQELITGSEYRSEFQASFDKYQQYLRSESEPQTLVDSIRFGIFNYCRFRRNSQELVAAKLSGRPCDISALPIASLDDLIAALQHSNRDLNEIMVHVLDFHYFFARRCEPYIDFLWESWATVPSVYADPEHYVLRTIAAISTFFRGDACARFNAAHQLISSRVSALKARFPSNVLFMKVCELLERGRTDLLVRSTPNMYLAALTACCLSSSRISGLVLDDTLSISTMDGNLEYMLELGSFQGESISSAVAFLADRARRASSDGEVSIERTEYESAWIFLVTASAFRDTAHA